MTDPARKVALRRTMRQQRKSLPASLRQREEMAVREHLRKALGIRQTTSARSPDERPRIGMYLAAGSELDLTADDAAWAPQAEVHVPVIRAEVLLFAPAMAPWTQSALGLREPEAGPQRAISELDAVLMPLLACDMRGTRLGQGGGWYDRTLAAAGSECPPCIGIGFDCQLVEVLPAEPHDQPVDVFLSARGARAFTDKGKQWLTGF